MAGGPRRDFGALTSQVPCRDGRGRVLFTGQGGARLKIYRAGWGGMGVPKSGYEHSLAVNLGFSLCLVSRLWRSARIWNCCLNTILVIF